MMDGTKFRAIRNACGFTQEQLAELLGVRRLAVSKYERGVMAVPAAVALAMTAIFRAEDEPTMEEITHGS